MGKNKFNDEIEQLKQDLQHSKNVNTRLKRKASKADFYEKLSKQAGNIFNASGDKIAQADYDLVIASKDKALSDVKTLKENAEKASEALTVANDAKAAAEGQVKILKKYVVDYSAAFQEDKDAASNTAKALKAANEAKAVAEGQVATLEQNTVAKTVYEADLNAAKKEVQALKQTTVAKADYDKVVADKGVVESNLATLQNTTVSKADHEASLKAVIILDVHNNIFTQEGYGTLINRAKTSQDEDKIYIFNTVDAAAKNDDKYPQPLYQEVRGKYCQDKEVKDSAKWIPSNPLGLQEFCQKTFDFMGTDAGKAGDDFDLNAL